MKLDEKTKELIAVGATIMANNQSSLEYHSKIALEEGADAEEIAEAIEVGKQVRKGVITKMDLFVTEQAKWASGYQRTKVPSFGCCP
ncbi:MAG TPA: carboxymuconolactone decarboxylase family protein [Candidatus Deferrimicrobiaceae bacterium]